MKPSLLPVGVVIVLVLAVVGVLWWASRAGPVPAERVEDASQSAAGPSSGGEQSPRIHAGSRPDTPGGQAGATSAPAPAASQRSRALQWSVTGLVEAAGRPVAAAVVELVPLAADDQGGTPIDQSESESYGLTLRRPGIAREQTGEGGRFEFAVEAAGRYFLRARSPAWAEFQGEPFALDAEHRAHDARISLVPGFAVRGLVVDATTAAPLAGAHVAAVFRGDPPLLREAVTATTTTAGAFTLESLPAGRYFVYAKAEGYELASRDSVGHDATELRLQLTRLGGLHGRVLRSLDRAPVAEFAVTARKVVTGYAPAWAHHREFQAADGMFHWTGLPAGTYDVHVVARGHSTLVQQVTVAAGSSGDPVEFLVAEGGRITGLVVRADTQAPVAGAAVWSERDVPPEGMGDVARNARFLSRPSSLWASTDRDGRFVLSSVRAGSTTLVASHGDHAMGRAEVAVIEGGSANVEIQLPAGGALAGRALDPAGQGVRGAIYAEPQSAGENAGYYARYEADIAADGSWRMEHVVPGAYSVIKIPEDMGPGMEKIEVKQGRVRAGETTTVDFVARKADQIVEIELVDENGGPVADTNLIAVGNAGAIAMKVTDAEGLAVFEELRPPAVRIYQQRGFAFSMQLLELVPIPPGMPRYRHRLVLHSTGFTLRVVRERDGRPVGNAGVHIFGKRVTARGDTRWDWGGHVSGDAGAFRIQSLPPGDYYLCVTAPGFGHALTRVATLQRNDVVDLGEVRLGPGGSARLRVQDKAGAPISGVPAIVFDHEQRAIGTGPIPMTGPDGVLQAPSLAPGKYRAIAFVSNEASAPVEFTVEAGARADVTIPVKK